MSIRTLIIESDLGFARTLSSLFNTVNSHNFITDIAGTLKQGMALLGRKTRAFDVVVVDLDLPDSQGTATFSTLRDEFPATPTVVLSPVSSDDDCQIIRDGAQDCLVKDEVDAKTLVKAMLFAISRVQHTDARFRSSRNIRRLEELIHGAA